MKKLMKSKRGDGYIDVVVSVLVSMMVLVMALNIFSFFTLKQDLDYFTKEMLEVATTEGRTNGEVYNRYYELADETGIYPSYWWTADYYNLSYRAVQLGNSIKITMYFTTYVKGFGIFKIPVTLTATHSGLSEQYWK